MHIQELIIDRFDKTVLLTIMLVIAVMIFMLITRNESSLEKMLNKVAEDSRSLKNTYVESPVVVKHLSGVRKLISTHRDELAFNRLKKLAAVHPTSAEAHRWLADLYAARQKLSLAVNEYMLAVELNPDYLDNHTKDFIGKKIKVIVNESLAENKKKLIFSPGDKEAGKAVKTAYYMLRKIAGACE